MINKIKEMMSKKDKSSNTETPETTEENILDQENLEQEGTSIEEEAKAEESAEPQNDHEAEVAELKDKYLRLQAEFQNFKRRNTKERLELMSNAAKDTLKALLPVLDDFDRAKKNAEDDDNIEPLSEGVMLVYNKLHTTLKQKGLTAMETNGEAFDAELHEALTKIPAPSEDMKGKIIDTIEKGYLLNDKIIRHAKVVVGE